MPELGSSIARCATATPTMLTLNNLPLFELTLRHPTDAGRSERVRLLLDAHHAAKPFIPLFLPLRDQRPVRPLLPEAVLIELLRDLLLLVIQLIDVPASLVMQAVDRPQGFALAAALMRLIFRVLHLVGELKKSLLDQVPALGRALAATASDLRHFKWILVLNL